VLARAVSADPRAVAMRWPEPRTRALARLAMLVTEAPWRLSAGLRAELARAGAALDNELVLHVVALSAYFGHLNRVADAVGVPLDYVVQHMPPEAEPATPRYERAPEVVVAGGAAAAASALARRPATAEALAAWRAYVMERDAPLSRAERAVICARVDGHLGAGPGEAAPAGDPVLLELTDVVTLAPWALGDAAFAGMRAQGADDARIFDACVTASTAGVGARIAVALAALARDA